MSSANETTSLQDGDMAKQPKSIVFIIIIIVCIILNQTIAYFATPTKVMEERKYFLNILAIYTILVQWFVFIHAGGFFGNERTEKYYDLTGSITYLTTLGLSLYFSYATNKEINVRQIILSIFVAVWSARLGWFLFSRIHATGIDSRFTVIKLNNFRFMMAWTLQGVWVFLTMLPVLMLNLFPDFIPFGIYDYIGMPIWAFGFIFEVISDHQKSVFRTIAENKNRWIQNGLWSISRHPNYFGEIVLWIGVAIAAFGGLNATPRAGFVFISPIFVAFLLIFVSGIPMLEEKSDKRFGEIEEYQQYKLKTPVLVPFIGRAGNAMF
jgi:steroid 5-alpha reductase family enzyme